jgi:hypothetical protein
MLFKIGLSLVLALLVSTTSYSQKGSKDAEVCYNPNAIKDTTKRSIKSAVVGKIGDAKITINYHSPGVRKRVIWGGLVPYDEVWVTGAHDATTIQVDKDFIIGGKKIASGKYAIFTIPGKSNWTVILNKNWEQHLATEYDQKDDVIRFKVKPTKQKKSIERLQYFINNTKNSSGNIEVAWEKIQVRFPITTLN